MNRGYICLWRKSLDSGWIKNHKLWVFWTYCLMKASHKEYDAIIGYQTEHLLPGQFIFGRRQASMETGLSEQEIRTALSYLRGNGNLTTKSTNKYSIITIINWDIYQPQKEDSNQQGNQPVTSQQPHTNTKTHKNINNSCSLPLKDGSLFTPDKTYLDLLETTYPKIDLSAEFQKMKAWCISNPVKQKTKGGVKRFINSWLNKENGKSKPVKDGEIFECLKDL